MSLPSTSTKGAKSDRSERAPQKIIERLSIIVMDVQFRVPFVRRRCKAIFVFFFDNRLSVSRRIRVSCILNSVILCLCCFRKLLIIYTTAQKTWRTQMWIIYCWFPNKVCSRTWSKLPRMSFELEPSEVMHVLCCTFVTFQSRTVVLAMDHFKCC